VDRLALFDIDCTLIDAHGAGSRAILAAIADTYGVSGGLDGYSFHGRTDPGIVADLAIRWGVAPEVAARRVPEALGRYLQLLRAEAAATDIEVLPGVRELVTALAGNARVLLGLLTGNVEDGARLKLAPTGLLEFFPIGAYGSDSALRPDLPPVAVARAEALTGGRFTGKQIVVIGDTPADIECGAALGVKTIAVATGRHTTADLAAYAPDHVFADLSDWRAVAEAILA
jgi:phosphoglycolate phosphatase